MSNNSLLLVDPNFKADASVDCHLLFKITNDSFSYAIVNKTTDQVLVVFDKQGCEELGQDLRLAFQNDAYLSLKYAVIKAALHTSKFIFVPDQWFDGNNLNVYAKYLGTDEKIYTMHHEALAFNTLFSLDENIKEQLPDAAVFFPQSAPLLALFPHLSDDALLIDFTSVSFNILLIRDKKIHFQNHYQAETADEFNYFLLLIMEQLGLTENIPVYLEGIINEDDPHYNCLVKYFNQLYFFLPADQQNSELLADMPNHYFSGLLALDLCE